jgi:hypothetical protein
MRKILTPVLLFGALGSSYAQKAVINWGEESKKELSFNSFVCGESNDLIKLCFEGSGGGMFSKRTITPVIARYDEKLQETNVRSYTVDDKDMSFNELISVKKNLFLFTSQFDKDSKATNFYAQQLNIKSLQPEGKPVNLGSFDSPKKSSQSTVDYELSKDSTKILMFGLSPYSKKEKEKYYLGVYDYNMKKLWENTIVLPYPDKYVVIMDYLVTNEGKVGVIIKHYDQEVSKEEVKVDGEKVPAYKTKFLLYDETLAAPKEFVLQTGGKFIHTLQLTDDAQNKLSLFGLYKEKSGGNITGFLLADIDKNTREVKTSKMNPFPIELLDMVRVDKQGSNKEKDPGLSSYFSLAQVVDRKDGSKDYLLEYSSAWLVTVSSSRYSSYSYWQYDYGDIIDINLKSNGSVILCRLPKMQSSKEKRNFSNFKALPYKDKVVIFYNDERDNVDRDLNRKPDDISNFNKCVFVMATIDSKGKMERQILFDHKDVPLSVAVRNSPLIGDNRIGLYAQKNGGLFSAAKDMIGTLELK